VPKDVLAEAGRRADALLSAELAAGGAPLARLTFATELLTPLAVEFADEPSELARVAERLATMAAVPGLALATSVMRSVALTRLAAGVGVKVELAVLLAFSGAQSVSLWCRDDDGGLMAVCQAGELEASSDVAVDMASAMLDGGATDDGRGVVGIVVDRGAGTPVALVMSGVEERSSTTASLLDAAARALSVSLERDDLIAHQAPSQYAADDLPERRLSRLRFDLHDGPQQDVVLLAEDLRLFGSQLDRVVADHPDRDRLLGRLEDLQARLVALDGDLRRISSSLQSPFLQPGSLPDAVAGLVEAFRSRTGIGVELRVDGDMSVLTDSQHITLLGLIRESLNNVREHSEASDVEIELSASDRGVEARVSDNGRGFDPETSLVRAARRGHLGLVGMHERVRMLGGTTDIDSRPGGPTVISVMLPAAPAGAPRRAG
jgi:signal transduction histidine kinase